MGGTKVPVRRQWLFSLVRDVQVLSSELLDELSPVTLGKIEHALASLHPPSSHLEKRVVRGLAAELFAHGTAASGSGDPSSASAHTMSPKVAHARELIDSDCAGPWDLNRLSRAVQWNRTTLANAFRAEVGMSIHRYLMSRRIAMARDRLANSDDKIAAIAMDVGYSHAAFQRTFRRFTGISPSRYRAITQRRRRSATK